MPAKDSTKAATDHKTWSRKGIIGKFEIFTEFVELRHIMTQNGDLYIVDEDSLNWNYLLWISHSSMTVIWQE